MWFGLVIDRDARRRESLPTVYDCGCVDVLCRVLHGVL